MKTINVQAIENLITQGFVVKNKHPYANLWIYNYSQTTQYEQFWNEETLQCRGLIIDGLGNIIARPFEKFFNIEEVGVSNLPQLPFNVYEKMDGSLGILYWLDNELHIATRGSFTSKQAIYATALLHKKYTHVIDKLDKNITYLFEIIYPENRIVVDYGTQEALVLIGMVNTATGEELPLANIGFPLPKMYNTASFEALKNLNWDNHEGFIVKFTNNYRVKIKFKNYIDLHKVVTQISSISIWEHLKEGATIKSYIENVPDEFYQWIKVTEERLQQHFKTIEQDALNEYQVFSTKKETALYFKSCKYPAILFAKYTGKNYSTIIWKMIRPKFEKAYVH